MNKIPRSELDNRLELLGILKCLKYEVTGEYHPQNMYKGSLVIELNKRPFYSTITSLLNCLVLQSSEWFLFPRFTYLGSEKNTENLSLPISPDESDGIRWAEKDLELISTIVSFHATTGWQIGWDLYLSNNTGNYLILVSHHDEIIIQGKSKKALEKLGECLAARQVTYENNI